MSSSEGGVYAKVAIDDNELSGISASALQAEYESRIKARTKRRPKPPEKNPRAKEAGSDADDASVRDQRAQRRAAKIHGVRNKRAAKQKAAEDEAFRRVQEQARRQPAGSPRSGTRSRPSSSSGRTQSRRRTQSQRSRKRSGGVAKHFKVLDLPNGSSPSEVKTAYRKLMRKYHPDMHTQSPKKHKAATELTMKVAAAYSALEEHFKENS